jgi:hypothetical protein
MKNIMVELNNVFTSLVQYQDMMDSGEIVLKELLSLPIDHHRLFDSYRKRKLLFDPRKDIFSFAKNKGFTFE